MELSGKIARPDGTVAGGRISFAENIESVEALADAPDDYILPGFIDLQVNGSHGIDVLQASVEQIRQIGSYLAREGTTAFLPTSITAPIEKLEQVHSEIRGAMKERAGNRAAEILGMHAEGPFISGKRLGAHPELNQEPVGEALRRLLAMDSLRLVTIAPELNGALAAIQAMKEKGIAVSIGHTDATFEQAEAGVSAGAGMFTHLFNAMRPLHQREPGVIGAALNESRALAAVIPDGVHVHPEILKLLVKARGAAGIVMTSDRIALSGASPEKSVTVGRERATIIDGAPRLADGTLAGSIVTMLEGLRLMVEKVSVDIGAASLMASSNPARVLGLKDRGAIERGRRADFAVLDRNLKLKTVFVGGAELR